MTNLALMGGATAAASTAAPSSSLYCAVWRLHFYAGLIVLPFLIVLSITGGLYLFKDEIDRVIHRAYLVVEEKPAATPISPDAALARALAVHPEARPLTYIPPAEPTASAQVGLQMTAGDRLTVYVDPYSGRVLGATPHKGTVAWILRRIHSLDYFGTVANGVMEAVAGWTLVLVATGFYLWWPRGRSGGVATLRGRPAQRVFWRDLHAVTGAFAGLLIAFLAISGLPWSAVWGKGLNQIMTKAGLGYPKGLYEGVPASEPALSHAEHLGHASWTLETAPMPASHPARGVPISLDRAVTTFEALAMPRGFAVTLPSHERGVYTAAVYPDDVTRQRVIHLDQFTGKPLLDMRFADYGSAARVIEWGIGLHMGQPLGLANQLLMLTACLAIVAMSVSAVVMWWKRRPRGSLGAPPAPRSRSTLRGVLVITGLIGIAFPLTGLSLLAALILDWLAGRIQPHRLPAPLVVSIVGLGCLVTGDARAEDYRTGPIVIERPWSRATPGGAKVGAGYAAIRNTGAEPDRLIGGSSEVAGRIEIHEMSVTGGIMRMRTLPNGLEVAPGAMIELKPGGYHIMLLDLKRSLKQGERIKGSLTFEKAGTVGIEYEVQSVGAQEPAKGEHHR